MDNSYKNPSAGNAYINFSNSPDGKIQQEVLFEYINAELPKNADIKILDAGCGNGWLAGKLSADYKNVMGYDVSKELLDDAKKNFPNLEFTIADISKQIPFPENNFEVIILNMVAHDLEEQMLGFKNIHKMLKPNGLMILTIINPYYAFPVGKWKRSLIDVLLRRKPALKVDPYNAFENKDRAFTWNNSIPGYFYTLPETVNNALAAGFKLKKLQEIKTKNDSPNFNLGYRLYRYPIILLLTLEKSS